MAVATRTQTTLSATITQTTLVNALITAFTNAGYATAIDNYTSGTDRILVYRFDADNTKTFGSNYIRVRVTTALAMFQQIFTGWNATTHVGDNGSSESSMGTISTSLPIAFNALNAGTEYKFVVVSQSTTAFILGVICPTNRPSWWDLSSWSYGFYFTTSSMNVLSSSSLSPYSSATYSTFINTSTMGGINPQTNRRDILTGIVLLSSTSNGAAGRTSDDVAIAAASGSARFDIFAFPDTTNQYLLMNNVTGGLALRIQ